LKLSIPDKCINYNTPKNSLGETFKYHNLNGSYFVREPKQEIDVIDIDLKKYYLSRERGIDLPKSLKIRGRRETVQID
jgi:hypothetical protein